MLVKMLTLDYLILVFFLVLDLCFFRSLLCTGTACELLRLWWQI